MKVIKKQLMIAFYGFIIITVLLVVISCLFAFIVWSNKPFEILSENITWRVLIGCGLVSPIFKVWWDSM